MTRPALRESVVVVTGATSGIGRASALAFAEHGARLVVAARSAPALADVVAECEARHAQAVAVVTDVADPVAVDHLGARAIEEFGRIDVWVQSAAVIIAARFGDEPLEELHRLVATNVLGSVYAARTALARFRAQGSGVLIDVSSMLGVFPNPLAAAYVMSKFAVRGLSLSLHHAVAEQPDVHVCAVLPGPVDTPMFDRAANHLGRRLRAIPPAAAPERVAATIVACARRPRPEVTVGVLGLALTQVHRIAPRITEWFVARWSAALLVRAEAAAPTSATLFAPPPTGQVHGGWRRGRLRRRLGEQWGRALARRRC